MVKGTIIALHGDRGAGKDTLADYLEMRLEFMKVAFADPLRKECAEKWQVPLDIFTARGLKDKEAGFLTVRNSDDDNFARWVGCNKPDLYHYDPLTPRYVLQLWSDYQKSVHGVNYYTKQTERLLLENTHRNIVISDCRLPQEAALVDHLCQDTMFGETLIYRVVRPVLSKFDANTHFTDNPLNDDLIDGRLLNISDKFSFCKSSLLRICKDSKSLRSTLHALNSLELNSIC